MKTNALMIAVAKILVVWLVGTGYGQNDMCYECHGESDFATEDTSGNEISLFVDSTRYAASVHGEFQCVDCHTDVDQENHPDGPPQKVDCGICHDTEAYQKSVHYAAVQRGETDAPTCSSCHGTHDILPASNPLSRHHPLNIGKMCARCHANPQLTQKYDIPIENPLKAYQQSVHGVAVLSENNFNAATCISCHGSHDVLPMDDPQSPIYWKNVPETCGNCHGEIMTQYEDSIHWKAALTGIRNAPVCTDCHGEHEIKAPSDPASPVNPLRVSAETCERCHGSELIAGKYGIAANRAQTFENSYHGLAIKGGSLTAANCASCHGIHNILPSSNPNSLIAPANLSKTCGKCHKEATADFAKGPVHITNSTSPGQIVQFVKTIYLWLIIVVIGGMILHNGIDFVRKARAKLEQRLEQ